MLNKFLSLFKKKWADSNEFDYTNQYWGHALHGLDKFNQKKKFDITGHYFGAGLIFHEMPKRGDTLIIKFTNGAVGILRLLKIEFCRDPSDMFHATVKFEGLKP
ncbi:hypothetical protein [Pectobacterium brasiliense]|uniref:hypothetical protein n=1 Tax=Pectobacterium brasiliense TaxID=180957 RepID=UPI002083AE75|nr:hypothetical protein [Pectobacterium brasiliense]WJM80525.1 hypothetical protein QTI90_20025 [Pectobacterium brasiliense]GKX40454.1 hypothetical protein SOASR014_41930 [Pectobacterium carotovorum subsp. carotovorum]GLX46530.1 hypothetical protein Pcaca01_41980 [Pectobacterium carotovorum subsp. carotovorum]